MATYTMPLHALVDGYTQNDIGLNTRQRIEKARSKIFDFDYPFFDEGLRSEFETHFIRNFYTREIGFETEGLFKFQLETWLQINMPFYNKLLESETLSFNPLQNVDVSITTNLKNQKDQNDAIVRTENETENETGTRDTDTQGSQTSHTEQGIDSNGNSTSLTTDHAETSGESTSDTDRSNNQNMTDNGTNNTVNSQNRNATTENVHQATSSHDKTTDTTENNFERNLKSDTPQTRLAITTNDGTGVIEYASSINEDKEKNVSNQSEDGNTTENATTTNTQNEGIDGTSNVTTSNTRNTTDTGNETNASTASQTSDSTSNNTSSQSNSENLINDQTVSTTNQVDEAHQKEVEKTRLGNQSLDSAIQILEDFAKQEVGKTGSMTYSKMLAEYRSTFLRIERDIFNEMNELFMLVY